VTGTGDSINPSRFTTTGRKSNVVKWIRLFQYFFKFDIEDENVIVPFMKQLSRSVKICFVVLLFLLLCSWVAVCIILLNCPFFVAPLISLQEK